MPGTFADVAEITDVRASLQPGSGLYASHIRDEGDNVLPAVDEALTVSGVLGIRVEVSHLKAVGRQNHGKVADALARIDAARHRGVRAYCDACPYTAGSTYLTELLPPWAKEGGVEAMIPRQRTSEARARLWHELENGLPVWSSQLQAAGAGTIS